MAPAVRKSVRISLWIAAVAAVLLVGAALVYVGLIADSGPKETIYVMTDAYYYTEDGICRMHKKYSYDFRGYCKSLKIDSGELAEVWDDEAQAWVYDYVAIDGSFETEIEYIHGRHGNLTHQTPKTLSDRVIHDDVEELQCRYIYDENGFLTTAREHNGSIKREYRISCDGKGRVVKIEQSNVFDDGFHDYKKFRYDAQGRLVYEWMTWGGDPEGTTYEYIYENDRLVQFLENDYVWELEYNSDGTLSAISCSDDTLYTFTYNGSGLPVHTASRGGSMSILTDDFGNIAEVTNSDGERVVYEYTALTVSPENAAHYYAWLSAKDDLVIRSPAYYDPDMYGFELYLIPDPIPDTGWYR